MLKPSTIPVLLACLASAPALAAGPSFPCTPAPSDALARLTCTDPALALSDLRMVQTYYALRQALGTAGQGPLKSEFLSFVIAVRQSCGLPTVQPGRDQSADALPPAAARCVATAFERQRAIWLTRLSGPAAEEAARSPEGNIALQARLKALGLLPGDAVIDGVFGTGTRTALAAWQRAAGRPETGFFGNADATLLLDADAARTPSDVFAALRDKPLAEAAYEGKPVTVGHGRLGVAVRPGHTNDARTCQDPDGGILSLGSPGTPPGAGCGTVSATVTVDGKEVWTALLATADAAAGVEQLHIGAAIRWLDPAAPLPQVVLSGYTGGAHCCTSTVAITAAADGAWTRVDLGRIDGDSGPGFLHLANGGAAEMVSVDNAFLYRFASYAGSNAPTRIRRLTGDVVQDTTAAPHHRRFLLQALRDMEAGPADNGERNGYLAGWVAQKALVGQFEDGWRRMLASYDRKATDGLQSCAVAKRAWVKGRYGPDKECPPGQDTTAPFPEALALFLVEHGYITPAQAASVGYDPAAVAARREAAMEAATLRYERRHPR